MPLSLISSSMHTGTMSAPILSSGHSRNLSRDDRRRFIVDVLTEALAITEEGDDDMSLTFSTAYQM